MAGSGQIQTSAATIRTYNHNDRNEVLRLLSSYDKMIRDILPAQDYRLEMQKPGGVEMWLEELLNPDSQVFVAAIEDHLAGIVFGKLQSSSRMTVGNWGALGSIYVVEAHRGAGIAKALYQQMEQWFASRGCTAVCVETWLKNEHGIEYYKKLGFRNLTAGFAKELDVPKLKPGSV